MRIGIDMGGTKIEGLRLLIRGKEFSVNELTPQDTTT
ncbi:MAG: hypothetical protein Ct9H300mP21_08030 [Pseudomonadota bacterium]|nr:MAG: hypothetical protein Ct9H300mP21_08030 [Pseudomonadota bacterium]